MIKAKYMQSEGIESFKETNKSYFVSRSNVQVSVIDEELNTMKVEDQEISINF